MPEKVAKEEEQEELSKDHLRWTAEVLENHPDGQVQNW